MDAGQVQVYVSLPDLLLWLFLVGAAAVVIAVIVYAAIQELNKPSAHEQRLIQIQVDEQQAENELTQLTQDYLQKISNIEQPQRSQKEAVRKRTPSNAE